MKYIKTYENKKIDNLKKYFIYKNNSVIYSIYKIIGTIETNNNPKFKKQSNDFFSMTINREYYYLRESKKLIADDDNKKILVGTSNFRFDNIIYTSDNLEDCVDFIKTILNSIKYNL